VRSTADVTASISRPNCANGRAELKILGLVTETHDAGLALLEDGVPVLVLEEERFNREKHTQEFPRLSLEAAFAQMRLVIRDIDVITTPWDMRALRRTSANAVLGWPLRIVALCSFHSG
jgi:predicted NodU family carbamoyl transferase